MNNSSPSPLRKGDLAFFLERSHNHSTLEVVFTALQFRVNSWGKKEGTGTFTYGQSRNCGFRFYTHNSYSTLIFRTREEVETYVAFSAPLIEAATFNNLVKIDRDWLETYQHRSKPEIVAKVRARLQALETKGHYSTVLNFK